MKKKIILIIIVLIVITLAGGVYYKINHQENSKNLSEKNESQNCNEGIYMDKVNCESADAVYELKGNAELPVKNVQIKNVKVGSVKKFVKKVSNVENVVEKKITYQMENHKD